MVSEEDAQLALEMAEGVREEARAAAAEAQEAEHKARAAAEAREAELKARAAAMEVAAREAWVRAESTEQAQKEREVLRKRAGGDEAHPMTTHVIVDEKAGAYVNSGGHDGTTGGDRGGGGACLRRESATEAAAHLPALFDFGALPDEVAGTVLRALDDYGVAAVSCASKRFNMLAATDDALWRGLQLRARRHPAWRVAGTWKAAFFAGTTVDAQWRRMQFQKKDHRAHSEFSQTVAGWGASGGGGH